MPDMQGKTVVVTGGNSGHRVRDGAPRWRPWAPGCSSTARNADKGRAAVAAIAERLRR